MKSYQACLLAVMLIFPVVCQSQHQDVIRKIVPFTSDKGLKAEVHLSSGKSEIRELQIRIFEDKTNEILKDIDVKNLHIPINSDTIILVEVNNLSPKLWSTVQPFLYNLEIKTRNSSLSQRIGFRKFEMIAGQFYLNSKPIYLRGNAINPPNRGIPKELEESREFAQDYVRFMKSININLIRIPENQNWLDVCDEEGMMVFGGRYGRPKDATATEPPVDFQRSVETYKNIELGPFTSHPSVVIYVLSNEMPYEGVAGDRYRDFLTRLHQELKLWDDTRLYIGNAGYGLGKSADIYDVHRYWGWYYNTFLTYLNMRDLSMWQNPGKVQPITFSECVGNYTGIDGRFNLCSRTKQPVAQKCWTGHTPDSEQADAALTYQAFMLKSATEMFRRFRSQNNQLAGTMPFTIMFYNWDGVKSFSEMKPKPAALQYRISYQPVLLSWENWQTQAYAGSSTSLTAHIVNDDELCRDLKNLRLSWWIENGKQKIKQQDIYFENVPYFSTVKKKLSLPIPADLPTGNYAIKGEVFNGSEKVSFNETELFVAGKEWGTRQKTQLYVYDNQKTTTPVLTKMGYLVKNIKNIQSVSGESVLIIGENCWDSAIQSESEQLLNFIKKGGRVVCLKQSEKFNTDWLSVNTEMLNESNNSSEYLSPAFCYKDGMNINMERPDHPVFKGLERSHFRLWSDYTDFDESKPGFPQIYPVTQGFDLKNNSFGNIAILANYSRGLAATALCEISQGKGSFLLSGFDLINRLGKDPVADRLFQNMISYMSDKKQEHPVYVFVKDSILWGDFISENGIVTGAYNGLMLNTTPIIPEDQLDEFPLKVDQYGYQYAGSYGGWNTKPGIQYVPNGRRPMAPFSFSMGGSPVVDTSTKEGEGFFYASIPQGKKLMYTLFENVVDEPLHISIAINDREIKGYIIPAKEKLNIKSDISFVKGSIKVSFKGDRRTVILQTRFE